MTACRDQSRHAIMLEGFADVNFRLKKKIGRGVRAKKTGRHVLRYSGAVALR